MAKLFLVPIEPINHRYSEAWLRYFPPAFKKHMAMTGLGEERVFVIPGVPLSDEIKVGTFLDINSTVHYKATQLCAIAKLFHHQLVPPGSVFFFFDLEFWGIESVRLMADMCRVPISICGFLHAASYTEEDAFSIATTYQKYTEVGWLAAVDTVFVGSDYHKKAVTAKRILPIAPSATWRNLMDKVRVTKNPIFLDEYQAPLKEKERQIILPNRVDPEKRPHESIDLIYRAYKALLLEGWSVVVTTGRKSIQWPTEACKRQVAELIHAGVLKVCTGLTKHQYHEELAKSYLMVSHSIEENYGYCIAEALLYRSHVLLREGLSHDEFLTDYPEKDLCQFSSQKQALERLAERLLRFGDPHCLPPPELDTNGVDRIVYHTLALLWPVGEEK